MSQNGVQTMMDITHYGVQKMFAQNVVEKVIPICNACFRKYVISVKNLRKMLDMKQSHVQNQIFAGFVRILK